MPTKPRASQFPYRRPISFERLRDRGVKLKLKGIFRLIIYHKNSSTNILLSIYAGNKNYSLLVSYIGLVYNYDNRAKVTCSNQQIWI